MFKKLLTTHWLFLFALAFCLLPAPFSCSNREAEYAKESLNSKNENALPDTLLITSKAAVFFQPDSLTIAGRLTGKDSEDFRMGMDDYLFSLNESLEFLKEQKLSVIDAFHSKYILFKGNDNSFVVKIDSLPELWGLYLFEPGKQPLYADITDIETEYGRYFK